ncbi:MAG: tetratricopeptide repeat protein, partial [Desulfobulbia bacterium]
NTQLINSTSGHSLWSERFTRDLTDLFEIQDEIVRNIVATLAVKVDVEERKRAQRSDPENLQAYDYVLRGRELRARTSRSANAEARKMIREAIELDPQYGLAYVELGWIYMDAIRFGWTSSPSRTLQQAYDLAQKALTFDKRLGSAHRLLATTYYKRQKYDLASSEIDRALKLNPNDADAYDALGAVKLYDGESGGAIKAVNTALRFNPNLGPSGLIHLGLAYYLEGQYQDAIKTFDVALGKNPRLVVPHVGLTASYAMSNDSSKAEKAAAKVRLLNPFFKVDAFGNAFRRDEDRQNIREGLRKAGLN